MKKVISLIICLFIINLAVVSANDCDILKPTLDKYYSASKAENLEEFLKVIDIDYARKTLFENYEDYIKSAWEVYDISNYEIKAYNCKIENNDAIFYFNLKATLVAGETIETQKNYIWIFHKLDDWKIRYVMDEEIFDQYQDTKYENLFVWATEEVIDKTIEEVNDLEKISEQWTGFDGQWIEKNADFEIWNKEIPNSMESDGLSKKTSSNSVIDYDKNTFRLPYIILLSIIIYIAYKFIRLKDYKKLKDLDNKWKAIFIWKKSWEYLKEYMRIVWNFTKKASIIIAKFLKTTYIKSKPIIIKLAKKTWGMVKKIASSGGKGAKKS